MGFSVETKNRAWMVTVQEANMQNLGLSETDYKKPEYLASFLSKKWNESGKGRTSGVAVCVSEKGLYHAHMACYGNTTTLLNVSKILGNSHVEPQLGGKDELKSYLLKRDKYAEKGEDVLYALDIDCIKDNQGKRNDLTEIENLLDNGYTPQEIMEQNFAYRKFEKNIKAEYISRRIKNAPVIKETFNEWHFGTSGTGKTFYYNQLCQKFSPEQVYMCTDMENGGLDFYIDEGAPPILFLDEFRGMQYSKLLTMLDKYSRTQTHCRYANTYNLWQSVIITSVFSPEDLYNKIVENPYQQTDTFKQLMRRMDVIVYHFIENGEYRSYAVPASKYNDIYDLKRTIDLNLSKNSHIPLSLTKQLIHLPKKQLIKLGIKY